MKKNQVFFTLLMILAIGAGNMQAATAKWYSNGVEIASQEAEAGTALNIPANPTDEFAGGYTFVGWTTEPIEGKAAVAPTLVNTTGLQMPENDINYYAVFGREEQKTVIANPNDDFSIELPADTNIADRVGLDNEQWSLKTVNGYQNTKVTLFNNPEKGGKYIAFNSQSQGGASMTITAPATIDSVRLSFTGKDYSKVWIKVNDDEVVATNGVYAIDANAFTIGAKNDATKQVRITQIDVIFASASYATTFTKPDPEISWSATEATYIHGEVNELPTLKNDHQLVITFESTDESVAVVDQEGNVAPLEVTGTTIIKAIFAGDEDYKAKTVSYTLNVKYAPVVQLAGDFTEWGTGALTLTPNEDYTKASVTVEFAADAWPQFKMIVGEQWRGLPKQDDKFYLFHRDWNSAVVAGAGENMQLHTDYAGEYTFTWTYATDSLEISFPAIPEIEYYIAGSFTEWETNWAKMTEDAGAYVAEINITSTGDQEFKVVRAQGGIKTWYGLASSATMTSANCENWTIGGGDANIGLQPTKAGDYKFVFTPGDELKLTVVYPAGGGTGVDEVQGDKVQSTKVLRGNQIFILLGNKTYTIDGQMVK